MIYIVYDYVYTPHRAYISEGKNEPPGVVWYMKPYPDDTGGGCFRFANWPHSNQVDLRHTCDGNSVNAVSSSLEV